MSGEVFASGIITADMSGSEFGWLQINMENFQQCVGLILMPRHFGGGQWLFVCSELNRPASVLWRPPGALFFWCRQYWGRRPAYLCQFGNPIDRAHIGRAKIESKALFTEFGRLEDSAETTQDALGQVRPSYRAIP